MKKVYVCAPWNEDPVQIQKYAAYCLQCGTVPVVPHFLAGCIWEQEPKKRETLRNAGRNLLWLCDELWCFGQRVSADMEQEIQFCKHLNIRRCFIPEQNVIDKLGGNTQ